MSQESFPIIDDLLNESNNAMDELFAKAFETFEQARKRLDRLQAGAAESTPAPTAEINVRVLVAQGEGSHEVRVSRGWTHQVFPCIPIPCVLRYGNAPPQETLQSSNA